MARLVGSISAQVLPLLFTELYCWVLTAVAHWSGALSAGKRYDVSRVGEKALPIGPAPTKIVPEDGLLVFHHSEKT